MSARVRFAVFVVAGLAGVGVLALTHGSAEPKPKEAEKEAPPKALYHTDRDHLWNRVHAALMRVGPDGKTYGDDRLEPLLWHESKNLLEGKTAERAVAVLEEFVKEKGEILIDDPLKRAVLQRDLWLVFSWLTTQEANAARKRLEVPLAKVIRRLALTPEQIAKLPDNYAAAVASKKFADRFDPEKPERSYLPPDLFKTDGPWVCVAAKDGPTAPLHLDAHNPDRAVNPFANSTFLVFLKLPGGREATLDFLKQLAAFDKPLYLARPDAKDKRYTVRVPNPALPQMPKGTEVALVRRALLVDSSRRIVASPLVESVQVRVTRVDVPKFTAETFEKLDTAIGKITDWHAFAEFQMRRVPLFAKDAGGLRDVSGERDFKTGFNAHVWDVFTLPANSGDNRPFPDRALPFRSNRDSCFGCHQLPGVYSFNSFHMHFSTSARRDLDEDYGGSFVPKSHALVALPVAKVEDAAVKWREGRAAWKALRGLLPE